MATNVNPALWDKLVEVLHSLTQWKEVIIQWKVSSPVARCSKQRC